MEPIQFDIEQCQRKKDGIFDVVQYNSFNTLKMEELRDSTLVVRSAALLSNYLAQCHGRERCRRLYKQTRTELLAAQQQHNKNRLNCYSALEVEFVRLQLI